MAYEDAFADRRNANEAAYVFRFPVQSAANVIQVLSEDRSIVYAMFMTMPTMRDEATEQHEVLWK